MAQSYGHLKMLPVMIFWRLYSIWIFENHVCGRSSC